VVLEIASGVCVHGYEKGRHVGAEGAFSVRTVYPWLSREQPPSTVNTWQVRISHRVFLGDFVQYLVEWAGHQLVVRRPPTEHFDRGRAGVSWYRPRTLCVVRGIRSLKRAPYWGHIAWGIMHSVEWTLFITCPAAKLRSYVVQSQYWCSGAYCIAR
jgi:hypothetical protein